MSLENENSSMVMPVSPLGYGGYGSGLGYGGDATWLIILFLFAAMGGWGNGFGGGFGGGQTFPWMLSNNTDSLITGGFNQANTTSLLGDIQNAITTGFANAEVSNCNRSIDALQTAYTNQIAGLQQDFAMQSALQNCCCENRAGLADLKYTVATEACADRAAVNDALRDVIAANTASTQKILDQMCQDKIDSKNEKIAELQQALYMKDLAASQTAQTARILADNAAQTTALEQYLNPTPIPAYPVQNPNCCNWNNGCGCGSF